MSGISCSDAEHWDRTLRLTLIRGETLRLPRRAARLRVLAGTAWVSLEGADILLQSCESLPLSRRRGHEAVISATGESELFLELDKGGERNIGL